MSTFLLLALFPLIPVIITLFCAAVGMAAIAVIIRAGE